MKMLTYKGYQGRCEYDHDAGLFHGEVMHLADVITFQGRTLDELKGALADSIEDYLGFCALKGRTPEAPRQPGVTDAS
jgi:predicted HicB family RNase H-like nuclease